jgi:uncharacterized protein
MGYTRETLTLTPAVLTPAVPAVGSAVLLWVKCYARSMIVLLWLIFTSGVQAASFDCTKASTNVEKMICNDANLSTLDENMAAAYSRVLMKYSNFVGIKQQQRDWISQRNQCKEITCLTNEYNKRIAELQKVHPVYVPIYPEDLSEFDVDCTKAKSKVEKIICQEGGDPLEKLVARQHKIMLYWLQWALMRSKHKHDVIETQRQWRTQVRDACTNGNCLTDVYPKRSRELEALSERPNSCYVLQSLLDDRGRLRSIWRGENGQVKPIEPVCQAFEDNLNQFCDRPPMVCGLKVAPVFKGEIRLPEWKSLNGKKVTPEMLESFIRAPWDGANISENQKNELWEISRQKIEAAILENRLSFLRSDLDLYNLGSAHVAYRLDYGNCKIKNPQLTERIDGWDKPIKSNPVQIQYGPNVVRSLFESYDPLQRGMMLGEVFLYSGKTYTYVMGGGRKNELEINRYESELFNNKSYLVMQNICTFNYQPKSGVVK